MAQRKHESLEDIIFNYVNYRLWYKVNESTFPWQSNVLREYNASASEYEVHVTNLTPDTFYVFRLDITRMAT